MIIAVIALGSAVAVLLGILGWMVWDIMHWRIF